MNIVRVCPVYYPYMSYGGSVVADYMLDKALVSEGHAVTVLTGREGGDRSTHRTIADRHEVRYFSVLGDITYGISVVALFRLFREIRRNGKTTDLVWFGGVWNLLTVLGPLICRLCSVKYIITPHGMLISQLISMRSSRLKRLVIRLFLKSNLENAYKVHFTVKQEFIDTEEATGARMTALVFPLCLDLKRFDEGLKKPRQPSSDGKLTLSFIGRITPKKRIDLIIDALRLLPRETRSKLVFRVVGTDREGLWNHQQYTEDQVGVSIEYLGPLYDDALVAAFHDCDVFVLCSESENFAISVVEAAYCYSALLITREVGVSEYFPEGSATYSELSAADISEEIVRLVNNPDKVFQHKLAARKVSEMFEWSRLPGGYFQKLLH